MTLTRRLLCGCLAAAPVFAAARVQAQGAACEVYDAARQKAITPDVATTMLMEGNGRFVAGRTIHCDLLKQVKATSHGQAPFATVLGCIDSRVPPEIVFDQRIGDIFSVRIAGNFADEDVLGSLEFATKVSGSKLIVVLGHTECGAIKGAIDGVKLGHLTGVLANFEPAIAAAAHVPGPRSSKNHELVNAACEANAKLTAASLAKRSPVLGELVDAGALKIMAALDDLGTGRIRFLG